MRKTFAVVCAVVAFGTAAAAPDVIVPGYFYPSGIQAGKKIRVVTGGMGYQGVNDVWISGEGVRVTKVTHAPAFPRSPGKTQRPWVREWLYDIIGGTRTHRELPFEATTPDTDWQKCDWWANLDERDDLELQLVARDLWTPEDYPQATPALDRLLLLDVEADANAKPGLRTLMLYDRSKISAPHPFYVTAEPHAAEPSFVIPPLSARKEGLKLLLHYPNTLPAQTLPVVLDGQVWPGETDVFKLKLRKGTRVTCVLNGRELLPYLGDAVPGFFNPVLRLLKADGGEVAFADDFRYLPDPILSCLVPEDGEYRLEVRDNLYRGRADFVYEVKCYEDEPDGPGFTARERAFECYPIPASHLPPKAGQGVELHKGCIDFPGRVVRHDFHVSEPKALSFELFARRLGSPLDGELRLYGPLDGKTPLSAAPRLATWTDIDKFLCGSVPQAICDARGSWNFLEAGDYCLTVSDEADDGGEEFVYALAVGPLEPSFEVYATQSSFLAKRGTIEIPVKVVRRNGFKGAITFETTGPYSCDGLVAADENEGVFTVTPEGAWKGMRTGTFTAVAEIAPGVVRRVPVVPGDPVEQAFAYTHYLPSSVFYFLNPES